MLEYLPPDPARVQHHGTTITLSHLSLGRLIGDEALRKSMARRFLLHSRAEHFTVTVNGTELPDRDDLVGAQFVFPGEYAGEEQPLGVTVDDGWGVETLANNLSIRWRIAFHENPIDDEELRGIAVFANRKLAQVPFFFNLTGGLSGQHGQEYMTGQVHADFVDELPVDIISPERQRINWQDERAAELLSWGQEKVKEMLRLWKARRVRLREDAVGNQLAPFAERLNRLSNTEKRTVSKALLKLAQIETIDGSTFTDLATAILTAWEAGRLHDLIDQLAETIELNETALLGIMVEANVLTALHTAEAVRTKVELIAGLNERIASRHLENAVRDYIANNPWMIAPEWETFQIERGVENVIAAATAEAELDRDEEWRGRIDLTLSSGNTLLVLEFMRPGLTANWDHVNRFERYVRALREALSGITASPFKRVVGYLVADNLSDSNTLLQKLLALQREEMSAMDWPTLLSRAASQWRAFLRSLVARNRNDDRLRALAQAINEPLD